jgi:UPF0271 protein
MSVQVDLNCDMGESFGAYSIGADEAMMPLITSANIACGFHAGDPQVMIRTVQLAKQHGVSIGAHPGFRDLVGFGRREMNCTADELYADVLYQVGAMAAVCRSQHAKLHHVKAHGALYNMANASAEMSQAIASAVADVSRDLVLFALPDSHLQRAGVVAGLKVACEVFGDRAYNEDGTLVSRRRPGALHHDPEVAAAQVRQMVLEGTVTAITGKAVPVAAQTICVHGDNPHAVGIIKRIRERLTEGGVVLAAPYRS